MGTHAYSKIRSPKETSEQEKNNKNTKCKVSEKTKSRKPVGNDFSSQCAGTGLVDNLNVVCFNFIFIFFLLQVIFCACTASGSPILLSPENMQGPVSVARNIRHLPCISRRSGEEGICMFAIDCLKANGTHLGTCIDRFYFGSCCQMPKKIIPQIVENNIEDNSIDTASFVHPPQKDKEENNLNPIPEIPIFPPRKPPHVTSTTTEAIEIQKETTVNDSYVKLEKPESINNTDKIKDTMMESKTESSATILNDTTSDDLIKLETTTRPLLSSSATAKPLPSSSITTTEVPFKLSTFQTVSIELSKPTTEKANDILTTLGASNLVTEATTLQTARPAVITTIKPNVTISKPKPLQPILKPQYSTKKPTRPTLKPVYKPPYKPRPTAKPVTTFKPFQTSNTSTNFTSTPTKPYNTTSRPRPTKPVTAVFNITKKPQYKPPPKRPSPTRKPVTNLPPRLNITLLNPSTTTQPAVRPISTNSPVLTTITYINTTSNTVLEDSLPSSSSSPITTTTTTTTPISTSSEAPTTISSTTKETTTTTTTTTELPTTQQTSTTPPTVTAEKTSPLPVTTKSPTTFVELEKIPTPTEVPSTKKPTEKPILNEVTENKEKISTAKPSSTSMQNLPETTVNMDKAEITTLKAISSTTQVPIILEEEVVSKPETSYTAEAPVTTYPPALATAFPPGLVTWSNTVDTVTKTPEITNETSEETWSPITPPEGWVLISTVKPSPESTAKTAKPTSPSTTEPIPTISSEEPTIASSSEVPPSSSSAEPITETTLTPVLLSSAQPITSSATVTEATIPEFIVNITLRPTIPTPSTAVFSTFSSVSSENATEASLFTVAGNFSDASTVSAENVTSESSDVSSSTTELSSSASSNVSSTETVSSTLPPMPGSEYNMTNFKDVCGRRMWPEARIVGGAKSGFGRWPWQISLRQWRTSTYLHKCGAALLNENWAITAAHCVEHVPPSELLVRLGEHDLAHEAEPYGFAERRVQIVASHPHFDPATFEYDLALLRFYEPVTFQPNILPVCVPESDDNFVGKTAFVTGWGRLYDEGPLPSVLQEVSVPVINNSACEAMYRAAGYNEHIPNIFICAGWKKGGADSCEGDSGGPMVVQREDKRFVLGGVISWGIGCAEPNQPGVYTRISEFRDWINQILQF